jgi:hypothetical protein
MRCLEKRGHGIRCEKCQDRFEYDYQLGLYDENNTNKDVVKQKSMYINAVDTLDDGSVCVEFESEEEKSESEEDESEEDENEEYEEYEEDFEDKEDEKEEIVEDLPVANCTRSRSRKYILTD